MHERLRRVCAHLPPELVATVMHRIVETTVKYEQGPATATRVTRAPVATAATTAGGPQAA